MLGREKAESSWLGAEALPAGLAEINDTIEAWAAEGSRKQHLPIPGSRPAGLMSIAARWMREATRPRWMFHQAEVPLRQRRKHNLKRE